MKYLIILFILGLTATACKESFIGQTPVDGTAPKQVLNPQVINTEGGALITYTLPDEEDLLYVEARYKRNSGEIAIAQASVYTDTLKIEGLGDTTIRDIEITTIDRSFNRSASILVSVEPLMPPLHTAFKSLKVEKTVGGIDLTWTNAREINLIITLLKQEKDGAYMPMEMIYTSAKNGKYGVRKQAAVKTNYAFCVRDRWNNKTDTIYKTLTPLYEEKAKLTHYQMEKTTPPMDGAYPHSNLFDGNKGTFNHTTENNLIRPHQFTFKSEIPLKLRHIRVFHRDIWVFHSATPRVFEIWATTTTPNPDGSDDGWTKLGIFTSVKPSGLPGNAYSQEDKTIATVTGEEFTHFTDVEYQYFRYKLIEAYDGVHRMCFAELELYGEPHGYVPEVEEE